MVQEGQDDRSKDAAARAMAGASAKASDSGSSSGVVAVTVSPGPGPGVDSITEFLTYGPGEGLGLGLGLGLRHGRGRGHGALVRAAGGVLEASLTHQPACLCAGSPIGEVGFFTGIKCLEAAESMTVCRTLVVNKSVGSAAGCDGAAQLRPVRLLRHGLAALPRCASRVPQATMLRPEHRGC